MNLLSTRRLAVGLLLSLCAWTVASADVVPALASVTAEGPDHLWTYQLQGFKFSGGDDDASRHGPPIPDTPRFGGVFTLFGFGGYIDGSCAGPAGWTCSARDGDGAAVDLSWTLTGTASFLRRGGGFDWGSFSAKSVFDSGTVLRWTAHVVADMGTSGADAPELTGLVNGPQDGWQSLSAQAGPVPAQAGQVDVEAPVPTVLAALAVLEVPAPATPALAGLALAALALTRRGLRPARAHASETP